MSETTRFFPRALLPSLMAAALAGGASTALADAPTAIAFSGGGYHALSGAAAWMMGMMEREGVYDLGKVTANAQVIGANSGGSWFTTLSAYSPSFANEIQQPGAYRQFTGSDGYMGRSWDYISHATGGCKSMPTAFEQGLCNIFYVATAFGKQKGFANFLISGGGQWQTVVENSVFGKAPGWPYYGEVENLTLSSERNGWAASKDLVLASTLLTQAPSLTYTRFALLFEGVQTVEATQAFSPLDPIVGGVPLMVGSEGAGVDLLPGGSVGLTYGTWSLSGLKWGFHPGEDAGNRTTLANAEANVGAATLPVINAAAISSAAGGGFIDIPVAKADFKDGKDVATALNGFAPAYQMYDSAAQKPVMTFRNNVHDQFATSKNTAKTTDALAANKVLRFADGGFVDNTAVAQLLRYLQNGNGGTIPSGFNMVAFDNLPAPLPYWDPKNDTGAFPTGGDIAALFGFDGCSKKSCSMQSGGLHNMGLLGLTYQGPSARVFPADQYFPSAAGGDPLNRVFWSPTDDEKIVCQVKGQPVEQPLLYSRYAVTVDANAPGSKMYGISSSSDGVAGTLHVFAFLGADAAVVPGDADQFACYQTAIPVIVDNVKKKGEHCDVSQPRSAGNDCSLGDYLQSALKL
ncbi:hypothetical protein [Endothiovibrio diazotrophicus]